MPKRAKTKTKKRAPRLPRLGMNEVRVKKVVPFTVEGVYTRSFDTKRGKMRRYYAKGTTADGDKVTKNVSALDAIEWADVHSPSKYAERLIGKSERHMARKAERKTPRKGKSAPSSIGLAAFGF